MELARNRRLLALAVSQRDQEEHRSDRRRDMNRPHLSTPLQPPETRLSTDVSAHVNLGRRATGMAPRVAEFRLAILRLRCMRTFLVFDGTWTRRSPSRYPGSFGRGFQAPAG